MGRFETNRANRHESRRNLTPCYILPRVNFRWSYNFRSVRIDSVRIESNRQYFWRIVKYVTRIGSCLSSRFKNDKHSCIIISWVLTSGGANRVESSSASDESTLVGCIGHVCKGAEVYPYTCDKRKKHQTSTDARFQSFCKTNASPIHVSRWE